MRIQRVLSRLILSSWFLAIFPAILLSFFLPEIGKQYTLQVENSMTTPDQIAYIDLNGDGITERLQGGRMVPYNRIVIQENELRNYDQWNLRDNFVPYVSEFDFGNFDHDRFKEVYVFTVNVDSVFLNVNEFFENTGTHLTRIFITKINLVEGEVSAVTLKICGFYDEDGDGKDELYFGISCGFGLEPRLIYSFNIETNKIKHSPFTGTNISNPVMKDIDGDNRPEIFGHMSAAGNYHTKTPFTDYSTWLMILDDQFQFKFHPIEFPGFGNKLNIKAFRNGDKSGYIAVHTTNGADTMIIEPRIMVYSAGGMRIRERLLSEFTSQRHVEVQILDTENPNNMVLITNPIHLLDEKLEVIKTTKLPFRSAIYSHVADVDDDGKNELLIYSEDEKKLVSYNAELTKLAEVNINLSGRDWQFSHYVGKNNERKLFLKSGDVGYFVSLTSNPYFFVSYLIYPAIYFAFVIFIVLVQTINTHQVARKEELKRRLLTLQLQSVKGQFDPHFTFNALNSVASILYLGDRESAYDYLSKFTRLLRQMLNDADRIYRSLQEELEFVTAYLNLEKLRFEEKFHFEITVGSGVTQQEQVPKMALQIFAENAVKHGIMPLAGGGLLKIKIEKEKDFLKLTIEDNGIGRVKAAELNPKGKGLKITDEFYEILNQINPRSIKQTITDLHNEAGNPLGTKVEVWVPISEHISKNALLV